MTTLAELHPGERARVLDICGCEKPYRQKLMAMGLNRGAEFTLLRRAPLGDPVAIQLRGYTLCLRQREAATIVLERINS